MKKIGVFFLVVALVFVVIFIVQSNKVKDVNEQILQGGEDMQGNIFDEVSNEEVIDETTVELNPIDTNSNHVDVVQPTVNDNKPISTKIDSDSLFRGFLIRVNKRNLLPDGFVPQDLVNIYKTIEKNIATQNHNEMMVNKVVLEAFTKMVKAASNDGLKGMNIASAYRTYEYQKTLFNNRVNSLMNNNGMTKDEATAATSMSIAYPGTSEHQTGLVIDIGDTVSTTSQSANDTKWYGWLADNCYDYGFIIRYQKHKEDITEYVYEPWHLRYVGLPHSQIMKEMDLCLEEYIDMLEANRTTNWGGYEIKYYYMDDSNIPKEIDEYTTVSGDGMKGMIFTRSQR